MKILAIGATGFVGSRVTRQLMLRGHQIALFHRGGTTISAGDSLVHFYGTRNQLPNFKATFEQFAPDVVLDIIPYTEAQAQDIVQVFSNCTQHIVTLSSGDVYRNYEGLQGKGNHYPDPVPLKENAPLRETRYPYRDLAELDFEFKQDYDKILVEQVLMDAPTLSTTILRLPAVYGEGDRQHRFLPYLQRMFDRRLVILLEDKQAPWQMTHGYVENVAAAIARSPPSNTHSAICKMSPTVTGRATPSPLRTWLTSATHLYIHPTAQLAIAKFSSYPTPTPDGSEFFSAFAAFPALASSAGISTP